MPSFAEADLLPKFTALTNIQPDCPIPNYMRLDAKLFFTNFTLFRRPVGQAPGGSVPPVPVAALAPMVPAAPAVVATSRVDASTPAAQARNGGCALVPAAQALTAQALTPAVAATSSHRADSPMDSAPVSFVKVTGKLEPHSQRRSRICVD